MTTVPALLVLALFQGEQLPGPPPGGKAPAGESIRDEFLRIGRALYEGDCAPVGAEPSRTLERMLAKGEIDPKERIQAIAELGREWLELGKVQQSIDLLEKTLKELPAD